MNIKIKAYIFASKKCNCERCQLCYPDSTCEKYDEYVKLYEEIATEQGKLDCVYALKEFARFLGDIADCMPEWKETIDVQRTAWLSTFKDRLYKKITQKEYEE